MKISKDKANIVSAIGEHPHQFGRWAVSIVVGEFASKEDAETAQGMLDAFISKCFIMMEEETPPDTMPKK